VSPCFAERGETGKVNGGKDNSEALRAHFLPRACQATFGRPPRSQYLRLYDRTWPSCAAPKEPKLPAKEKRRMTISTIGVAHLQPIVSLIAGILILIMPQLLNYIVAIFLIVSGILGLGLVQ
jgi:hypothetical protein